MFQANTELQVSDMQFNAIKSNIKTFIKNKTEFSDYDFEGSTISYLIDILAYNTYMNSFYTNMAINETYLDTAQIRSNVVSNAKKLGYTPTSAKSARARITLYFQPSAGVSQLKIPKGTTFTATKDGKVFNFVTIEDYTLHNELGIWSKTIDVYQGNPLVQTYFYSPTRQYYPILERNIDTDTLRVKVSPNAQSFDEVELVHVDSIVDITPDDNVYFIQENSDEKFELYFGNGILGRALENGNLITLEYLTTEGPVGNGIASFKAVGYSAHDLLDSTKRFAPTRIVTEERSAQGTAKESIESIRFNAPNNYFAQNRLVTIKDYENFVYGNFPFVQSINVWGGEDHWTPLYGKVIMSIKPLDGYALPATTKNEMISMMKAKNVLAIEPLIIDPIFTFIRPTIRVTYDSTKTNKTFDLIYNSVSEEIQSYEAENLSNFGKSFRYSQFIRLIDSADKSILGNDTEILLEKRFVPIYGSTMSYKLNFGAEVRHPYDGYLGGVSSVGFYIPQTNKLLYLDDDGFGKIRQYYIDDSNIKRIFNSNCGTVNYSTGEINLKAFYFTGLEEGEDEMKVFLTPESRDYTQVLNQIILISNPRLFIIDAKNGNITKSGIVDTQGNISPLLSSSVAGTLVTL